MCPKDTFKNIVLQPRYNCNYLRGQWSLDTLSLSLKMLKVAMLEGMHSLAWTELCWHFDNVFMAKLVPATMLAKRKDHFFHRSMGGDRLIAGRDKDKW